MTDQTGRRNIVQEVLANQHQTQRRNQHFTSAWAKKLVSVKKLVGHEGCVNRLAWSEDGSLLASGSDDKQVLLWSYPDVEQGPLALQTEHAANIFGIQFMPCTNNRQLVTGAMDDTVILHHIDRMPTHQSRRRHGAATPVLCQSTLYGCHRARVKGVEVEPNNPHLFWSAAEDGTVRQYDLRIPSNSQKAWDSCNCLLSVKAVGSNAATRSVELKGISLNKAHVHQLAVAAGDVYVRLYDRRMLSTGSPKDQHVRADPVLQMAPPHTCLVNSNKRAGRPHTTCVSFGRRGDKLLATYHCDQAYAFDISSNGSCSRTYGSETITKGDDTAGGAAPADLKTSPSSATSPSRRPPSLKVLQRAEELKNKGNHAWFNSDNPRAVAHYSQALQLNPTSAMLHTNRAAALLSRDWVGDSMWALKDCEAALKQDPILAKAHYRRIQALKAMDQIQAAYTALQDFQARFAGASEDAAHLKEEVYALLEERAQHAKQRQWRLMQKKRARDAAQARNQQDHIGSDPAELNTEQAAGASERSPSRASTPVSVPSLSPLNIVRGSARTARRSRQSPADMRCPVPDVGLNRAVPWGTADAGAPARNSPGSTAAGVGLNQAVPWGTADAGAPARSSLGCTSSDDAVDASSSDGGDDATDMDVHSSQSPTAAQTDPPPPPEGSPPLLAAAQQLLSNAATDADHSTSPLTDRRQDRSELSAHTPTNRQQNPSGSLDQAGSGGAVSGQTPFVGAVELPSDSAESDANTSRAVDDFTGPRQLAEASQSGDQLAYPSAISQAAAEMPTRQAAATDAAAAASSSGISFDGGGGIVGSDATNRPQLSRLHAAQPGYEESESLAGEAEPPEEGWLAEEIDLPGVKQRRRGLLDNTDTWVHGVAGRRLLQRYIGHANVQTDIKEAIFMGSHDELVAAGSDDGFVFIYDATTGQVVKILQADEDVANCVQCHPTLPVLATSGIEHTIKLWAPEGPVAPVDPTLCAERVKRNQERIMSGPQVLRSISPRVFQALQDNPQLLNLLQWGLAGRQSGDPDHTDEEDPAFGNINCRVN